MEIRIKETNEIKKLSLIDTDSGVNWIGDFVGNNNGFGNVDRGLIDQDPDADWRHYATQETYDWWVSAINGYEKMQEQIMKYREKYGRNEIDNYLQSVHAFDVDLESMPSSVILALEQYEK